METLSFKRQIYSPNRNPLTAQITMIVKLAELTSLQLKTKTSTINDARKGTRKLSTLTKNEVFFKVEASKSKDKVSCYKRFFLKINNLHGET